METGWEEHYGYLRDQGYAVIVGEFGGHLNWPEGASQAEQTRWNHISTDVDAQWQNAFVDCAIEHDINACYWAINPESADTGGLYGTSYDLDSNPSGWGTWTEIDNSRMEMLKRLWDLVFRLNHLNHTKGQYDETNQFIFSSDQEMFINSIYAWAVYPLGGTCPTADGNPNCK